MLFGSVFIITSQSALKHTASQFEVDDNLYNHCTVLSNVSSIAYRDCLRIISVHVKHIYCVTAKVKFLKKHQQNNYFFLQHPFVLRGLFGSTRCTKVYQFHFRPSSNSLIHKLVGCILCNISYPQSVTLSSHTECSFDIYIGIYHHEIGLILWNQNRSIHSYIVKLY